MQNNNNKISKELLEQKYIKVSIFKSLVTHNFVTLAKILKALSINSHYNTKDSFNLVHKLKYLQFNNRHHLKIISLDPLQGNSMVIKYINSNFNKFKH